MPITPPKLGDEIAVWRTAVLRGRNWLSLQVGGPEPFAGHRIDVNWYGKIPWALAATGDRIQALHVLMRAQRAVAGGSLRETDQNDWTSVVPYSLGWLVVGARLSERYELARLFYQELQAYICQDYGGAYSTLRQSDSEILYFDAGIQGAILHAAVAIGDLESARRAGELMIWWHEHQPDLQNGIYMHFHPRFGHLRDVTDSTRLQRLFWLDGNRLPFANLGLVMQGLVRISEATGDPRFFGDGEATDELSLGCACPRLVFSFAKPQSRPRRRVVVPTHRRIAVPQSKPSYCSSRFREYHVGWPSVSRPVLR